MSSSSDKATYSTRNDWTPELFEQITDLMAEALFQDFQEHRLATVQSPQGLNHKNTLTKSANENKSRGPNLKRSRMKAV